MSLTRCLALLALAATACAAPAADDSDSTAGAIIGGTPSTDARDSAVVELNMYVGDDGSSCTATFISTTVLLTAAHCVVNDGQRTVPAKAEFELMTAPSEPAATDDDYITVQRANVHPHPDYDGEAAHDIAVVVLDKPFDVKPVAVQRTPLALPVGTPVRLVGYGQALRKSSSRDGTGVRRTVMTTLRAFEDDLVLIGDTGAQACDGDSGGPALATIAGVETLIATDDLSSSERESRNCQGGNLYQRPDLHQAFIAKYLE